MNRSSGSRRHSLPSQSAITVCDLIDFVAGQTKLTKADSEKAVNAIFEGITKALKKKEEAGFVGFGSFVVVKRAAREGRNPRTGETLKIKATNVVKFRVGKALKEVVAK